MAGEIIDIAVLKFRSPADSRFERNLDSEAIKKDVQLAPTKNWRTGESEQGETINIRVPKYPNRLYLVRTETIHYHKNGVMTSKATHNYHVCSLNFDKNEENAPHWYSAYTGVEVLHVTAWAALPDSLDIDK